MNKLRIDTLDVTSPHLVEECVTLLFNAFAKPERYSLQRLSDELQADQTPFYRKFFIAVSAGKIVGFGGVKAADWASNTHLLYLSAVSSKYRQQGIGRALIKARVEWIEKNFASGLILVSSTKDKRFRDFGFVRIPKSNRAEHQLMIKRF